ncbi:hypothetical protein CM19_11800 [Candidatus Acidianus copahuensis]|uniref:FUN14 family protein n=1 Tax=Candidatus Acidianus copahuensis TaxID=1160895 RepID=A0A031LK41_9CREN|nr:hypothetical protein [Candidatus Acidianus copahuensis]EZQ01906.1 hypothetical protein CM19_11800 [Candidatus Acidianus copahuensis]
MILALASPNTSTSVLSGLTNLTSSITTTDIISLIVAFVLGLLIGLLAKKLLSVALIIIAILIVLIAIGALSPTTVEHWLIILGQKVQSAEGDAQGFLKILPYNSIVFIIGFIIGLIKG